MQIRQLSVDDGVEIYEMLQRIGKSENEFHNEANGLTFDEFKTWLKLMDDWSKGENLPDGYVREYKYWLVDDEGNYCGYGKIREKLTEKSREFGGNLGFAVDPLYRGKGYGNSFFKLLLDKAVEMNLKEIISTVEKFNYPSKKVHEYCGGKLYKETDKRWYFSFNDEVNNA